MPAELTELQKRILKELIKYTGPQFHFEEEPLEGKDQVLYTHIVDAILGDSKMSEEDKKALENQIYEIYQGEFKG